MDFEGPFQLVGLWLHVSCKTTSYKTTTSSYKTTKKKSKTKKI